jgi:hypothetical protein
MKPQPVAVPRMTSRADSSLEEDIAALGQDELDAMLGDSIDAVLKSGGRG